MEDEPACDPAMVIMYSKPGCKWCEAGKNLLTLHGIEFEAQVIGEHLTREEFKEQFPFQKTVPCFVINSKLFLCSFEQLQKYISEEYGT